MGQTGRPGLPAAQKAELWQRWEQGREITRCGGVPTYRAAEADAKACPKNEGQVVQSYSGRYR